MVEVQCWEGDGKIPPEVSALIKRVTELEASNADLKAEVTGLEEIVEMQKKELRVAYGKLGSISRILAEGEIDEQTQVPAPYDRKVHPAYHDKPCDTMDDLPNDLASKMLDTMLKEDRA